MKLDFCLQLSFKLHGACTGRGKAMQTRCPEGMVNFIWFTDEKMSLLWWGQIAQNDRLYATADTKRGHCCVSSFSHSFHVQPVNYDLRRSVGSWPYTLSWANVNGQHHRDVLFMQGLLQTFQVFHIFTHSNSMAHRPQKTLERLHNEAPDFIPITQCFFR